MQAACPEQWLGSSLRPAVSLAVRNYHTIATATITVVIIESMTSIVVLQQSADTIIDGVRRGSAIYERIRSAWIRIVYTVDVQYLRQ